MSAIFTAADAIAAFAASSPGMLDGVTASLIDRLASHAEEEARVRYARPGAPDPDAPLRYGWENKGLHHTSPSGTPMYMWYDSESKATRIQGGMPGSGHTRGSEEETEGRAQTKAAWESGGGKMAGAADDPQVKAHAETVEFLRGLDAGSITQDQVGAIEKMLSQMALGGAATAKEGYDESKLDRPKQGSGIQGLRELATDLGIDQKKIRTMGFSLLARGIREAVSGDRGQGGARLKPEGQQAPQEVPQEATQQAPQQAPQQPAQQPSQPPAQPPVQQPAPAGEPQKAPAKQGGKRGSKKPISAAESAARLRGASERLSQDGDMDAFIDDIADALGRTSKNDLLAARRQLEAAGHQIYSDGPADKKLDINSGRKDELVSRLLAWVGGEELKAHQAQKAGGVPAGQAGGQAAQTTGQTPAPAQTPVQASAPQPEAVQAAQSPQTPTAPATASTSGEVAKPADASATTASNMADMGGAMGRAASESLHRMLYEQYRAGSLKSTAGNVEPALQAAAMIRQSGRDLSASELRDVVEETQRLKDTKQGGDFQAGMRELVGRWSAGGEQGAVTASTPAVETAAETALPPTGQVETALPSTPTTPAAATEAQPEVPSTKSPTVQTQAQPTTLPSWAAPATPDIPSAPVGFRPEYMDMHFGAAARKAQQAALDSGMTLTEAQKVGSAIGNFVKGYSVKPFNVEERIRASLPAGADEQQRMDAVKDVRGRLGELEALHKSLMASGYGAKPPGSAQPPTPAEIEETRQKHEAISGYIKRAIRDGVQQGELEKSLDSFDLPPELRQRVQGELEAALKERDGGTVDVARAPMQAPSGLPSQRRTAKLHIGDEAKKPVGEPNYAEGLNLGQPPAGAAAATPTSLPEKTPFLDDSDRLQPEVPKQKQPTPTSTVQKTSEPATTPLAAADPGKDVPIPQHSEGHHRRVEAQLANSPNLTDEQRRYFGSALRGVVSRLNPVAMERVKKSWNGKAQFYGTSEELRSSLIQNLKPSSRELFEQQHKQGPSAIVHWNPKTGYGTLYLDGDRKNVGFGEFGRAGTADDVYAHEYAHLVDGNRDPISSSDEWLAAFSEEIDRNGGPLTEYARTNSSEGFAEFGRLLLCGRFDHAQVKAAFPKAFAVWVKQGLVEDVAVASEKSPAIGELFDKEKRLDLGGGGHGDVLLDSPAQADPKRPPAAPAGSSEIERSESNRAAQQRQRAAGGDPDSTDVPTPHDERADARAAEALAETPRHILDGVRARIDANATPIRNALSKLPENEREAAFIGLFGVTTPEMKLFLRREYRRIKAEAAGKTPQASAPPTAKENELPPYVYTPTSHMPPPPEGWKPEFMELTSAGARTAAANALMQADPKLDMHEALKRAAPVAQYVDDYSLHMPAVRKRLVGSLRGKAYKEALAEVQKNEASIEAMHRQRMGAGNYGVAAEPVAKPPETPPQPKPPVNQMAPQTTPVSAPPPAQQPGPASLPQSTTPTVGSTGWPPPAEAKPAAAPVPTKTTAQATSAGTPKQTPPAPAPVVKPTPAAPKPAPPAQKTVQPTSAGTQKQTPPVDDDPVWPSRRHGDEELIREANSSGIRQHEVMAALEEANPALKNAGAMERAAALRAGMRDALEQLQGPRQTPTPAHSVTAATETDEDREALEWYERQKALAKPLTEETKRKAAEVLHQPVADKERERQFLKTPNVDTAPVLSLLKPGKQVPWSRIVAAAGSDTAADKALAAILESHEGQVSVEVDAKGDLVSVGMRREKLTRAPRTPVYKKPETEATAPSVPQPAPKPAPTPTPPTPKSAAQPAVKTDPLAGARESVRKLMGVVTPGSKVDFERLADRTGLDEVVLAELLGELEGSGRLIRKDGKAGYYWPDRKNVESLVGAFFRRRAQAEAKATAAAPQPTGDGLPDVSGYPTIQEYLAAVPANRREEAKAKYRDAVKSRLEAADAQTTAPQPAPKPVSKDTPASKQVPTSKPAPTRQGLTDMLVAEWKAATNQETRDGIERALHNAGVQVGGPGFTGTDALGRKWEGGAADISGKDFVPRMRQSPVTAKAFRGRGRDDVAAGGASKFGAAKYYSTMRDTADVWAEYREGGHVEEARVRLERPFNNVDPDASTAEFKKLRGLLNAAGVPDGAIDAAVAGDTRKAFFAHVGEILANKAGDRSSPFPGAEALQGMMREAGYDGVIDSLRGHGASPTVEIAVFEEAPRSASDQAQPAPAPKPVAKPKQDAPKVAAAKPAPKPAPTPKAELRKAIASGEQPAPAKPAAKSADPVDRMITVGELRAEARRRGLDPDAALSGGNSADNEVYKRRLRDLIRSAPPPERSARAGRALQFAKCAADATARGDLHSAAMYREQARKYAR